MSTSHFTFTAVRFLYPAILQPKPKYNGSGEEYSTVMLVPKKDKAQLKRFVEKYNNLVTQEFKGKKPTNLRPAVGLPITKAVLKDGDAKYEEVEVDKKPNYVPYRNHYYANLSIDAMRGKVEAVDADKNPIVSMEQLPSGARGHIVCEMSCYRSPKFGPQFSLKPVLVQVTDISDPIGPPRLSTDDALELLPSEDQADLNELLGDDIPF